MRPEQPRRAAPQRMGPGDVYPVPGNSASRAQRDDALAGSHDAGDRGLVVTETDIPGQRLLTTLSGGQVLAQFAVPAPSDAMGTHGAVTIGEALDAAGMTAGARPVGRADAAAVQAAEVRGGPVPGGLGSVTQAAADANARVRDEGKRAKLGDVLEEAERVRAAEERNYVAEEEEEEEEGWRRPVSMGRGASRARESRRQVMWCTRI